MSNPSLSARPGLALYAKFVVLAVFILIFAGGLVTSWGAGMAAPDWPVTFGSLNPAGWWDNFPLRLEHGHRLIATYIGFLTAFLAAAVWRHRILMVVIGALAAIHALYLLFGTPDPASPATGSTGWHGLVAGAVILAVGAIFALLLAFTSPAAGREERVIRVLALCALIGVCLQATLGGIRVTSQTAGDANLALTLRILHGCVAQAYLCVVVALATLLSPRWNSRQEHETVASGLRKLGWITAGVIYVQLIFGAAMRHVGAGLAIATFPAANPDGSFMPKVHNLPTDLNFTHTRFGAITVTFFVLLFAISTLRSARGNSRLLRPASALLALLLVQLTLGVLVVLHTKPPTLTTFHVLNGAALLATALLLTLRLGRFSSETEPLPLSGAKLHTEALA